MATKTLSPEDEVATVAKNQAALFKSVEKLILSMVRDGKNWADLSADQFLLCEGLGWDSVRIQKEFRRMDTVARQQELAGTAAERLAARERLAAANERQQTEGSKLRAELESVTEKITRQLAAIQAEVEAAATVVGTHTGAVHALRGLSPYHVHHAANNAKAKAAAAYAERIAELKTEIERTHHLAGIILGSFDGNSKAILAAKGLNPDLLVLGKNSWDQPTINTAKWREYVEQRQRELPEQQQEIREFTARQRDDVDGTSGLLDYYLPL